MIIKRLVNYRLGNKYPDWYKNIIVTKLIMTKETNVNLFVDDEDIPNKLLKPFGNIGLDMSHNFNEVVKELETRVQDPKQANEWLEKDYKDIDETWRKDKSVRPYKAKDLKVIKGNTTYEELKPKLVNWLKTRNLDKINKSKVTILKEMIEEELEIYYKEINEEHINYIINTLLFGEAELKDIINEHNTMDCIVDMIVYNHNGNYTLKGKK
jgi:hypothetical protein